MNMERAELSREQVGRIEAEIESLRSGHREMYRRNYREFFAHAKQISQLFKDSRAILHIDRERLWEQFSTLCDSVRQEQARERESRANASRVKKEAIEPDIREAYFWAKGSNSISDLQEADRRLAKVTEKKMAGVASRGRPNSSSPSAAMKESSLKRIGTISGRSGARPRLPSANAASGSRNSTTTPCAELLEIVCPLPTMTPERRRRR